MRTMMILILAALVTLLPGTASGQQVVRIQKSAAPAPGTSTDRVITMPFDGQRPVIEISLNGQGPYRFILDTGASVSVIDSQLAEELKLAVTGERDLMSPAGGEPVKSSTHTIEIITVGDAGFRDVPATSMNLRGFLPGPEPPLGILSAGIFQGMLLTLDYPGSRILLRPGSLGPADGSEIFQYDESSEAPAILISFAGVDVETHLDTGSPEGFTLPGNLRDKVPLESPAKEVGRARLIGREMAIYGARLKGNATFGKHTFTDPELSFGEFFPVGNIGYEILSAFVVTLDSQNRRLKLEQAAETSARPATGPKRYGVMFHGLDGNPLLIAGADQDSVAGKAGVLAGDRIIEMNGEPIESLATEDRIRMLRGSPLVLTVERDGQVVEIRMSLD